CNLLVDFDAPAERDAQCNDGVDNDGNGLMDCEEAACATSCGGGFCGDMVTDPDEECDDGDDDNTDACLDTCVEATCGDGELQARSEECDDDNTTPLDGCEADCTYTCGSGMPVDGRIYDPATSHCFLGFQA